MSSASRVGLVCSARLGWLLGLGGLHAACDLPEYRLHFSGVPSEASKLQLAVYLPPSADETSGRVAAEMPDVALRESKPEVSTTVNLKGEFQMPKGAVFAAVARDAMGCIVATGNSQVTAPSSSVADVSLPLSALPYPTAVANRCAAEGPVAVAIQRQEQGLYRKTNFRLALSGWGFLPDDQVQVTSRIQIVDSQCGAECRALCPEYHTACDFGVMSRSMACYTGCRLTSQVEFYSPGLVYAHLPEESNSIPTEVAVGSEGLTTSISFATLRGSPFRVVSTRKQGAGSASLTEVAP